MKNKFNRGFTLIELLIVIAVIAVFASIVLVSLSTARNKGNDAGVKSNLITVRSAADLFFDANNASYGTFSAASCPNTLQVGNMFSSRNIIDALNAAVLDSDGTSRCVSTPSAYAVAVGLKSGGSWCVDSLGRSRQVASVPASSITGTACN